MNSFFPGASLQETNTYPFEVNYSNNLQAVTQRCLFKCLDFIKFSSVIVVCTPLSAGERGEGVEPPTKFSKREDFTGPLNFERGYLSTLRGGGGVSILQKNKLKSEIFNDKKNL